MKKIINTKKQQTPTTDQHMGFQVTSRLPVGRRAKNYFYYSLMILLASILFLAVAFVFGYVLILGISYISEQKVSIFSTHYNPSDLKDSGAGSFIITSLFLAVFSILFAIPLAFGAACFLASHNKKALWNRICRLIVNSFNSTPSIIFGIIGMYLFVILWRLGNVSFSMMAGILTLAMVILPTLIISMLQAMEITSTKQIQNSSALGASKLNTWKKIILPNAMPGIITGIMLAFGRVLSESAPVFLTIGASYFVPKGFFDQGRSLTTEIFILITQEASVAAEHFAIICALITLFLLIGFNLTIRLAVYCYKRSKKISSVLQLIIMKLYKRKYNSQKRIPA